MFNKRKDKINKVVTDPKPDDLTTEPEVRENVPMTYGDELYENDLDQQGEYDAYDPAYDYADDGDAPELPRVDGTYQLKENGWVRVEETTGYWVASTDGDYDWEMDAEYGEFVGKWTDPKDAKVYIDRSFWYADRDAAIQAGVDYNQKAIWDIAANEEIRLDS